MTSRSALRLPRLRPDQSEIVGSAAKIKVVAMGRRWGKTVMAGTTAVVVANAGGAVAYVVPSYKNARTTWRFIEGAIASLGSLVKTNKSDQTITFPSGGWIGIYSGDNDTAIRGESFDLVIIDEAAQIREETYTDVILPTLADRDGYVILISTPLARNWFYKEYEAAKGDLSGDRAAWNAPTSANPNPKIRKAFELAKDRVSEQTFRQEWLAEFLEGEGYVFRRVAEAVSPFKEWQPYPGNFVMGLDWGKQRDFTVLQCVDIVTGQHVLQDRFNKIDYHFQRERIKLQYEIWKPGIILAEENSIGGPNIEELQRDGLPVVGFNMNSASKAPLIENLALGIERKKIHLLNNTILIKELEAFERDMNPVTNKSKYSAPEGENDDTVIALALAWWAVVRRPSIAVMSGSESTTIRPNPEGVRSLMARLDKMKGILVG